jgi:hypothetical protein
MDKAEKIKQSSKKASDAWKKIKAEKKTIKVIPVVTKSHPVPKTKPKGRVIIQEEVIDKDIQVQRKIFIPVKKKSSHPKLDKLLRGKHGK